MALKWTNIENNKVVRKDGTTAKLNTYSAKGKKNEYLFVERYNKTKSYLNDYSDSLLVNGKSKYEYLGGLGDIFKSDAEAIEKRQIASAKKRLEAKKNAPVKSKEVITEKETKKTGRKKIYNDNGRKFYIDESKVKIKNGKQYFFLKKTFKNDYNMLGRLKKKFLYIPVKKQGIEQWEVYILDYNDPYYKSGR